jgi:hypothetical protein
VRVCLHSFKACPKIDIGNYLYGFLIMSGMTNRGIVIVGLDPTIQRFRTASLRENCSKVNIKE